MKNIYKLFFTTLLLFLINHINAQWTQSAFDSTRVQTLKYVNGSLFAYSQNVSSGQGFLYMSIDSGTTWQRADSATFAYIFVHDIDFDSAYSYYVMVANGQNGIYYSTDGLTWTQNSGNLWSGDGIIFIDDEDVLSSANGGVARTGNGGGTWTASNTGLPGPYYVHYITRIGDTLYLSNQGTPCYISGDYGQTWYSRSDSESYFINCFYAHQGVVYAGLYLNGIASYNQSLGYWQFDNQGLPLAYQGVYVSEETNAITDYNDTLFTGGDSIGVWMNNTATTNGWQDFSCGLPCWPIFINW